MPRTTVGYQDECLHPMWLTRLGLRSARMLGAQSLWVPDHFMGFIPSIVWNEETTPAAKVVHSPDGFFDPMQVLALTASRMPGVDLGTAVTEAVRRHPMSLAQSFVTLDHISRGHAILGIGNGEKENIEPYGLPWKKQVSRLEEALQIIRLLWGSEGKPVNFDGNFWVLRDAVFNLPLYKGQQPRIWIASHAPKMLALTGKYGDGWLPTLKTTPEEYRRRLDVILAARHDAGRPEEGFTPCIMAMIALGRSRDEVIEATMKSRLGAAMALLVPAEVWQQHNLTHPLGENFKGFYEIVPPRITEDDVQHASEQLIPELLMSALYAGNAEEICQQLAPTVGAGAQHVILSNVGSAITGGGPMDLVRLGSLIRKLKRL
jgi:phthiodiolone/phenolphthiodiolone dimycocerosates ketoreductase